MTKTNSLFSIIIFAFITCQASASEFFLSAKYLSSDTDLLGHSDRDSGAEIGLGYAVNENLSIEASYLNFGRLDLPPVVDGGGYIDSTGYSLGLIYTQPIGAIKLRGKIGYLWSDSEGQLGSIAGPVSFNSSGSELTFSLGGAYALNEKFQLTLDFNQSQDFSWTTVGLEFYWK